MTEFEKLQARLHADMADLQATQEAKMYEERRKAERSLREREAAAVRREAADAARKREEAEEELLFEAAMRAAEQLRRDLEASRLVDEKKGELKLRATQTISKEYLKERSLKLGEGVVGTVAKKNVPMSI